MIREAGLADISAMHKIRMSVVENRLNNPELVKEKDYEDYLLNKGKGWVIELNGNILGFAIVDLLQQNVWALFMDPAQEGKGYGKILHDQMMNWYFNQTDKTAWLSTAPATRAASFYRKAGWNETGKTKNGELKFEISCSQWNSNNKP